MKATLAYVSAILSFAAFAGARTNTVKNATADWTDPSNFEDSTWLPGDGPDDYVIVPEGASVSVSDENAASLAQFLKLKGLIPVSASSRIEVTVGEVGNVTIPFPITCKDYSAAGNRVTYGPIVKKGPGSLTLSATGFLAPEWEGAPDNISWDYYVAMDVQAGTLSLPQALATKAFYGPVTVAEGATLVLPKMADAAVPYVTFYGFAGAGDIVCEGTAYGCKLKGYRSVLGGPADFSGKISGTYVEFIVEGDAQIFTGRESPAVIQGISISDGVLGASWLGDRYANSSLGHCEWSESIWIGGGNSRFVYTGHDEPNALGHSFILNSWASPYTAVIDGGDEGGFDFGGGIQRFYTTTVGMRLTLAGEGSKVNKLTGNIPDASDSNDHGIYLTKEGIGTWNLGTVERTTFTGGISIDEGVLQFGALAACGTAANLTDGTVGASDFAPEHRVDYAFRLGGPTVAGEYKSSGRLEYVGTEPIEVKGRPIAVMGQGGLRANGDVSQAYNGIYGISSTAMTLFLDGDGTGDNEVRNVSDGTGGGALSIVKEGSGKWILAGTQNWSGDLTVRGGELVVRNPTHYTWYEWVVTSVGTTAVETSDTFQPAEFVLCDAENRILSKGLKTSSDPDALKPGEAALVTSRKYSAAALETLFDDFYYSSPYWINFRNADDTAADYPRQDDESSWFRVRMRLRPTDIVASYDYCDYIGTVTAGAEHHNPSNYMIRASLDGINWDVIKTMENSPQSYQWGCWASTGSSMAENTGVHEAGTRYDTSLDAAPETVPPILQNVRSFSVSNGGRLTLEPGSTPITIANLKLDAATGGTVSGFAFAESGVLEVENHVAGHAETLPADFTDVSGLENLANWQVSFNGKVSRYTITVKDGKLTLVPPGMAIILR